MLGVFLACEYTKDRSMLCRGGWRPVLTWRRLGQEPPKEENNYVHDGRTLYEVCGPFPLQMQKQNHIALRQRGVKLII